MSELSPALQWGQNFAYIGGATFVAAGLYLSVRRGRLHPLLLVCISAISFSWIEAPYDWAMYAQFPPELPRMPAWWPVNMTWGGLPSAVPPGYIAYFILPAVIGASLGRRLSAAYRWRRPFTLLATGLLIGFAWAFVFNALFGPRFGVFYYGRVIEGLALWEGTRYQYPLYDALAMGVGDYFEKTRAFCATRRGLIRCCTSISASVTRSRRREAACRGPGIRGTLVKRTAAAGSPHAAAIARLLKRERPRTTHALERLVRLGLSSQLENAAEMSEGPIDAAVVREAVAHVDGSGLRPIE